MRARAANLNGVPGIPDPADQCSKCRKSVMTSTFMREMMLERYKDKPDEIRLIASGQIDDPQNMIKAEAVGAGGFVCHMCGKKYCARCGNGMNFTCCGFKLSISTHYFA
jgi:hypothetical protein